MKIKNLQMNQKALSIALGGFALGSLIASNNAQAQEINFSKTTIFLENESIEYNEAIKNQMRGYDYIPFRDLEMMELGDLGIVEENNLSGKRR